MFYNTQRNQKTRKVARPAFEGPFEATKTVQSGWMPVSVQVKRMELAGLQLQAYREAVFDFAPGAEVPEDAMDPTRSTGYDLADAWEDRESALERLRESARVSRLDRAAMRAAQKMSEGDDVAEDVETPV